MSMISRFIRTLPQSARILITGTAVPAVLMLIVAATYYRESHATAVDACVQRARAVCITGESVRANAEHLWAESTFSRPQLQQWAEEGNVDRLLATVPIVMSINSVGGTADESIFKFRVPALKARNPANQADEFQASALRELAATDTTELVRFDRKTNSVHYFRPVRLGESCLMCHGNPNTSQELWSNNNGEDVLGYKMENMKAGELYGAFELVQSLEEADAAAMATLGSAILIILPGLAICAALSLLVLTTVQQDIRANTAAIGKEVSIEVSNNTASIASAIEQLSANISDIAGGAASASGFAREVVGRVEATNEKGLALHQNSEEIGNIVRLIDGIAEQTNLLALNATIEAARAGESGKGFAVVAGEVKELARETSKATSTITQKISSIQGASGQLLQDLDAVRQVIKQIDDSQSAIATAVHEQQFTTEEIGRTIHSVLDSSRRLSDRLTSGTRS